MNNLSIIVATDAQSGIGIQNRMPWHLPEELAHFKRTTTGHAIIMGRKTFDSLGRALPNRRNIVITRNPDWQHAGVESYPSLELACAAVGNETGFIIGGAEVYAQALPLVEHLIVTQIPLSYACDAFFPVIDPNIWQESVRQEQHSPTLQLNYAIITYTRKR